MAQTVKNLPAVQETWVRSLGQEDPLEKGIATHSSTLAWRIPWTESLADYGPWGHKESDMTEQLTLSLHFREWSQLWALATTLDQQEISYNIRKWVRGRPEILSKFNNFYPTLCLFQVNNNHKSFISYIQLLCLILVTPWTVDCQAPLSMEFSRQEYCSGLLFPSPGDLPNPGIELGSRASQADSLLNEPPGKPHIHNSIHQF